MLNGQQACISVHGLCMISLHGISGFSACDYGWFRIALDCLIALLGSDVGFYCMDFLMSLHGTSDFKCK